MYAKAREVVENILNEQAADPLPDEVNEALDQILRKAEREIPER
jgi:trimethylamine:corrinoid methyltransferase-like protein